ncbi:MAG: FeoA family protein [Trueperaceae bacterium]|nr:FeoA family protein [Trueperaceae bacterium]
MEKVEPRTPVSASAVTPDGAATRDGPCEVCGLDQLACGRAARIVKLAGAPRTVKRLLALGVRPSTVCHVVGRSPNQGPLHLRAGSVHVMVRADDAAHILVDADPHDDAPEEVTP